MVALACNQGSNVFYMTHFNTVMMLAERERHSWGTASNVMALKYCEQSQPPRDPRYIMNFFFRAAICFLVAFGVCISLGSGVLCSCRV